MCRDWFLQDSEMTRDAYSAGRIDAGEFSGLMTGLGYLPEEIAHDLRAMYADRPDEECGA